MKLLDEQIKFRENLIFSLRRYPAWWIILLITMVFDYFSTTVFVSRYGIESEGNFVTRNMMDYLNPFLGNLSGKLLQLVSVICFVGLSRKVGNFFLLFIILINCWAVVMNSIG